MRNRLGILIGIVVLIFVLVGLNAATYVQREKTPDTEVSPNRSSFNSGATGTQAFYSLLAETGRNVTRWQRPIDDFKVERRNRPSTFVIVGTVRKPLDEIEVTTLLEWVKSGGRLILIDRHPNEEILNGVKEWRVAAKTNDLDLMFGVDPTDQKQMTSEMPASKPVQPSLFTKGINAVQTSRFASHIEFSWNTAEAAKENFTGLGTGSQATAAQKKDQNKTYDFFDPTPSPEPEYEETEYDEADPPPPPPAKKQSNSANTYTIKGDPHIPADPPDPYDSGLPTAPVVHLTATDRNILVEVKHGLGSISFLSDPYVVSNAGVSLVDNAQLGINLVTAGGGLIAFDEFHQGYGSNQNRFFQFFAGTPVIAVFAQLALIAAFVFYSQSRRFGRPVPEPEPDRRSKLEYVSAMAELQQRTQAYDLAIENIYSDFRRRVSRLFGVDNTMSGRKQLAALIAERVKGDAAEIENLMQTCEDIVHGEPTNKKKAIDVAVRIRELESQLGLARNGRARAIK
ncbi:MAG: DUF4350 domain-containing protein [Pyrinomonadaceae bacterium]|nr:DUF4350 domain-containing protein [Pyrinomonadaceae bacterium]